MDLTVKLQISAGLAILAGLLILFFPRLVRWALSIYLIVWGILQLF